MDLMEGIFTRRSIRQFKSDPVAKEMSREIIKAGTWAPSGRNNQPWRFVTVRDRSILDSMAGLTKYHRIIEEAPLCIVVFADKDAIYHATKDHQAIGACLQNMLLAAHSMGLGAVWLGEILKSEKNILDILELAGSMELMAVVAIGHPSGPPRESNRKDLSEVIIKEI